MRSRFFVALSLSSVACSTPRPGDVDFERLVNGAREPEQWLTTGRTWRADRFSPLAAIDTGSVTRVGFAWEYEARARRGRVEHGMEATPIVVDGTLYVSGPWGTVYAVDAKTGAERWRYDPEVDGSYARRACCGVVNRGVAVWREWVYVGTLDGYLVALDAASGREIWRVDTFEDRENRSYTITSAPQVAGNVVVIGNSGGEFGVRGYITAYDLVTGRQAWRFYTVPGDPAKGGPEHPEMAVALKTWDPKSDWASGLGGTVWGEMAYDPELNLLYVGTGNSSPYPIWFRSPSGGDNLFLVSILAINPDDGRMKWYYQTTPGEIWDYTATANMILADLMIEGRVRRVLMQAPKNGFFYVLDRITGELISGTPFVYVNWASGLDSAGRPIVTEVGNYRTQPRVVFPTMAGAHNWQPMAYSHQTGLVYIPAREQGMLVSAPPEYRWRKGRINTAAFAAFDPFIGMFMPPSERAGYDQLAASQRDARSPSTEAVLIAWDPVARKERWRVSQGTDDWTGGMLATAGNLVIQGRPDGRLYFHRAETGEVLHAVDLGTGIIAAPASYELGGEQYLVVAAGYGGALGALHHPKSTAAARYQNYGRILAFRLGGGPVPLPPARVIGETPEPPVLAFYSAQLADRGAGAFHEHCLSCHMSRGRERLSSYPDLHHLTAETHAAFDSIVLGGKLAQAGMASFADLLTPDEVRGIQAYLVREQRRLRAEEQRRAPGDTGR